MAFRVQVRFTPQLRRFVEAPEPEVHADTPRAALEAVFADEPRLRSYLLDDQGELRQHVALFVDGKLLRKAEDLDRELEQECEIHFMQALSGG